MMLNISKLSIFGLIVFLISCGGSNVDNAGSIATPPAVLKNSIPCSDLVKLGLTFEGNTSIVSATAVTGGSVVTSAGTLDKLPSFCQVVGVSKPTADSNINFEVWLPTDTWNGRFMSSGEGGYVGTLNYTRKGMDGGMDEIIRRGYVTASTDTGHLASDTFWAIGHPDRVVDYAHRAKHLVTVAAKGVISAYYGKGPVKSYLNSCSNGGRQALMQVQLYPKDFDGVVAGAPWNYQSRSAAGFIWTAQALSEPGAGIPVAKLSTISDAVLAMCDAKDGLVDGIIEDPRKCNFDPAVLQCKGADSNTCLTAPQVTALNKLYQGPKNPRTGESIYSGWAQGSEKSWTSIVANLPTSSPFTLGNMYFSNLVYGNKNWDFKTLNFDTDISYADKFIGAFSNSMATDMTAAKNLGVKVIMYQGWDDQVLQPGHTPNYFDQLVKTAGSLESVQQYNRLFMVPGMTHCYFGPGASSFGGVGQQIPPVRAPSHDLQLALENWVEKGVAPETFVATKYTDDLATTKTVKLQRLLCSYPKVARYKQTGDPNDVNSFSCVAP